jgi:hypothetical protein
VFFDKFFEFGSMAFFLVPHVLDNGAFGGAAQHCHLTSVNHVSAQFSGVVDADYFV